MPPKNSKDWIIKDHLGSAMQFRIASGEVLWGIVEAIVSQNLLETNLAFSEASVRNTFGVVSVEVPLNIQIKGNISNKYRKKLEFINKQKIVQTHVQNNLPIPPTDNSLKEHNLYRWKDGCQLTSTTSDDSTTSHDTDTNTTPVYVRVLGNGPNHSLPSRQTSLVQVLTLPDRVFEVERFSGDLIELKENEKDVVSVLNKEHSKLMFEAGCPPGVHLKYWDQRYRFLSKYDEGVILDAESWYSITAEPIANYITRKCVKEYVSKAPERDVLTAVLPYLAEFDHQNAVLRKIKESQLNTVLDCFSGCGGNTIPFARSDTVQRVVCVDWDPIKLDNLRHNASIYGCSSKISTHCGDVYKYLEGFLSVEQLMGLQARMVKFNERFHKDSPPPRDFTHHHKIDHDHTPDLIVMSPPWGGPDYCNNNVTFDLSTMLPCGDGIYLALLATTVCPNVIYLLPKNVEDKQIYALQKLVSKAVVIENIRLNGGCKLKGVYFGPLFKYY